MWAGDLRDNACPNMGATRSRPVAWKTGCRQRESERERPRWNERRDVGFLFGAILERGVTSLFQASERKGEWRVKRWRQRKGENVNERWRRSGFHQHNYKLPPPSTPVFCFCPVFISLSALSSCLFYLHNSFYFLSCRICPDSGWPTK